VALWWHCFPMVQRITMPVITVSLPGTWHFTRPIRSLHFALRNSPHQQSGRSSLEGHIELIKVASVPKIWLNRGINTTSVCACIPTLELFITRGKENSLWRKEYTLSPNRRDNVWEAFLFMSLRRKTGGKSIKNSFYPA
jgi:hypothetical protein